ncbi:hypothetical protein B0H11DRAFT_2260712 [Mycena galericulata]|nr:hypothetical protein B0H11DRAFT_2260712 [Mycena galericulata]
MPAKDACSALFDGRAAGQQRGSTDLVVYSVALEDVVQVAWPVVGSSRVPPHLVREYLRRLNVFWPCFCAKLVVYTQPHRSLSCRIMTGSCGSFALCHYDEPCCQFFYSIFLSASFEDQYQRLAGPAHLGPYTRGESYSPGGYVAGYLGDPGEQLGKLVIADDLFEERLGGYLRTMASIAIDATSPVGNDALYPQESNLFAKLCSGEAVPQAALKKLFSHCKACGLVFVRHCRIPHISSCPKHKGVIMRPARFEDYNNLLDKKPQAVM